MRAAQALGDEDTPEELILRAAHNGLSRDQLVNELVALHYTFAFHAPSPHEGAIPRTWTQVGAAHLLGLLSDQEYENVCTAVQPPTS